MYSVCCKIEDFAELGAGYTMYFEFIKFLIVGFIIISIVVGGISLILIST